MVPPQIKPVGLEDLGGCIIDKIKHQKLDKDSLKPNNLKLQPLKVVRPTS